MILERKVTINQYGSRNNIEGFILFRLASRLPMNPQVAKDAVVNHLKGELQAAYSAGNFSESKNNVYKQDMEVLSTLPIVYSKQKTFEDEVGDIYYTQLLLDLSAARERVSSYSLLPDIVSGLLGAVYGGYGMSVNPRCPLTDFTYEIANVKFSARNYVFRSAEGTMFTRHVYNEVNIPINNIAISVETNTTKAYNRNSVLRIQYHVYDNLVEAINAKTSNTIYICAYDGIYGTLTFCQLNEQNGGVYRFKTTYGSKVNAFWHKRMLVCYDGSKSLECVRPFFDEWADGGIRQVDILQFCSNKDFFYQEDMNNDYHRLNKTILHFLSKDRLYLSRSSITYRNGGLGGQVYYQPARGRKITGINLTLKPFNQNNYFAEFIVPVGEQKQHLIALDRIGKMIRAKMNTNNTIDVNLAFTEYKATMFESVESQDDVLAKWFSYCTKSSKTTDDGIIRAYMKMKTNLEKEYKEIGAYLNCYDFSKCAAVPRLEMDKKLRENCYKSLHIEPKNVIIKSINNKKINPINELRPTIRFMITVKGACAIGEMPLNKYYDAKTNSILLNYNKMKGEVIRDKIKNRR